MRAILDEKLEVIKLENVITLLFVKVDLGVCRGKQLHDKRDALKKKAMRRDLERGA